MKGFNIFWVIVICICLKNVKPETKFQLMAGNKTSEIPLVKHHSHSCQLVSFVVTDNILGINITNIDSSINTVKLELRKNTTTVIIEKQVDDEQVFINFDFSESINLNQSVQLTVNFHLSLFQDPNSQIPKETQDRKAYLLFPQSENPDYKIEMPIGAIVLTQFVGLILILILPLNIQYRKILPITYNIFTCFLYIILLSIAIYLDMPFKEKFIAQIQVWTIAAFSMFCFIIYTQDLLSYFFQNNICVLIFSTLIGSAVVLCDEICTFLEGAWFISDLIAIMVAGAFIKFVIIRKIKTAIWALSLMWLFSCFRQFGLYFKLQEFDQSIGIKILPLFLQIPATFFNDDTSYICSAFGSSKVICFGVLLNYCVRVDLYLSTNFYKTLGWILSTLCIGIQLSFNLIFDTLPTLEVMSVVLFYPIMVILMLFFANKRGEWAAIWHGSFYDMAVNRASIPRSVHFDDMQTTFGNDLLINNFSMSSADK